MKAVDWSQEIQASFIWLVQAFGLSMVLASLAAYLCIRYTVWGRQFWRIAQPFFREKPWLNLGLISGLLLFTLLGVRLSVLLTYWSQEMYNSLQTLDEPVFWRSMVLFAILATIHVTRALLNYLLSQYFTIQWRTALNDRFLARWLDTQAHYRLHFLADAVDNPDQRIQQDISDFTDKSLSYSMGVISAFVSIFEFTIVLWGLAGVLNLFGWAIPHGMVYLVYAYVLVSTIVAFVIGRPLIRLQYMNERLNASYRYGLVRVREYSEPIAFYVGELIEKTQLKQHFRAVIDNTWQLIAQMLKFSGFNLGVSQAAVVFPLLIQAPAFFAKQIDFGGLMATVRAFGSLQDSLSFFRETYDGFAGYKATLNRLDGLLAACDAADALPKPAIVQTGSDLILSQVGVRTPDGRVLLQDVDLQLKPGDVALIQGASGSGKTTLLRALAGLWPYTEGTLRLPEGLLLHLSQKPYLPMGTLRAALFYPNTPDHRDLRPSLAALDLLSWADQLDTEADWSRILSLGEQQRVAFARVLLAQPAVIFLDESTSAMGEAMQTKVYELLRAHAPNAITVSVGHRASLLALHSVHIELNNQSLTLV